MLSEFRLRKAHRKALCLFEAEFCKPASGWEKCQVAKNVRDARHRQWQVVPAFQSLADLNVWLEQRCQALWHEIEHGKLPGPWRMSGPKSAQC